MGNSNGSISNTFYRTFGIQYLSVEGAAIASDKETKVFGPYDTKEELLDAIKSYCEEQVRLGNMTQQEADEIIEKYE